MKMEGPVTWQAIILLASALWLVSSIVAFIVWRACAAIRDLEIRIIRLEERRGP